MAHRTVITSSYATMFASQEVREQLTSAQCTCADEILNLSEPSDEDIRDLGRLAVRAYRKDD